MNLWNEDGLPWGIAGLDTLEDLISCFVLSVGFEGDTYTSYTRISLEYHKDQLHDGGVLTDAVSYTHLINDGCGLYRGRLILPYEHLSRFQNDLID